MASENFTTLHTWDTIYCADTVEWCPVSPYKSFFVCGTYHLVQDAADFAELEGHQKRIGTVTLFKFSQKELLQCDQIKTSAVLDTKWCLEKVNDKILLASVDSLGNVCVFNLQDEKLISVTKLCLKKEKGDYLLLSLDWSKQITSSECKISVSDNQGEIFILNYKNEELVVERQWTAHSLEAWTVNFDSFNFNSVYTGKDIPSCCCVLIYMLLKIVTCFRWG